MTASPVRTPAGGIPVGSVPPAVRRSLVAVTAVTGAVLGVAIGLVAALRHDRPMHAVGRTYRARVEPVAARERSGVPWIDEPSSRDGLVRISRGAGLPTPLPDVQGVAIRLDEPHGSTDLLLASSGLSGPSRFALVPRRSPLGGPASTVMPFRAPHGPVVLAVEPLVRDREPWPPVGTDGTHGGGARAGQAGDPLVGSRWRLLWSGVTGPWRPFAELTVGDDAGPAVDRSIRFDPVTATPPGLPSYRWARLLRTPAYRLAQIAGRPRAPR